MGWMRFSSTLVGDVAWPIVLITALGLFRKQIGSLIDRVKAVSWRDVKVDLGESTRELDEVEREVQHIPAKGESAASVVGVARAEVIANPSDTSEVHSETKHPRVSLTKVPLVKYPNLANWDELRELIPMGPDLVVHLAGEVLDEAVRQVSEQPHPIGMLSATMALEQNPKIPPRLVNAILQLQRFRNQMSGNIGLVLTSEARNFVDNTEKAIKLLEDSLSS